MTLFIRIGLLVGTMFVAACVSTGTSFPTKSLGTPYENPKIVSSLLFMPKGEGPFPAIVLLQSCGGARRHVTQDWPNYLTDLGYVVLAVDTLGSRGVALCTKLSGARLYQAEDAVGAFEHLATLPSVDATRIGVMGFSMGAMTINETLVRFTKGRPKGTTFKAAVGLYGWCRGISGYDVNSIPLMEIAAEKDVKHGPSCVDVGRTYPGIEVHVLPGAYHAFDQPRRTARHDPSGTLMMYSGSATTKARELTKAFFEKHL